MRYKILSMIILGLLFSACSNKNAPTPKKDLTKDKNITVVTQIEDTTPIITPIEHTKIVEKKRDKYNFKPEPFSLESNENDPELLGPQTTLSNKLKEQENKKSKSNKL